MSKTKQIFRKWLPLALIPMMSVAVLSGCSSDDDDDDDILTVVPVEPDTDGDGDGVTTPVVVGDTDGNGIPDAFEANTTGGTDINGDNIDDIFGVIDTDNNTNGIDDSFEASVTGGADANQDGIDDDAASTLDTGTDGDGSEGTNGNGTDGDGGDGTGGGDETGGEGTGGGDETGGEGTGGGDETGGTGGSLPDTGSLGDLVLGNPNNPQGTVDVSWDGRILSGSITPIDSVGATGAALFRGIAASNDPGEQVLQLSGTAPNFTFPIGLSEDQIAPIVAGMARGNLFVLVQSASGPIRSDQFLPPGGAVVATFTALESNDTTVFSNGAAFLNVNTITGDYTAYLNVNLNPTDTDSDGNPITVSAANIHQDSINGTPIIPLADTGAGIAFSATSATGQLSAEILSILSNNNGWFNVQQNDGNTPGASFVSGQIQLP